jgi:hypothetical protein
MTVRTRSKIVAFLHPFVLEGIDEVLPAGDYRVETDEELIEGIPFLAYRRVSVCIHLPSPSGNPALSRTVVMPPGVLDSTLLKASIEDTDRE